MVLGALAVWPHAAWTQASDPSPAQSVRVALVQFDAVPGQRERNLAEMERLVEHAVSGGAHLVMFHELATSDYVDDIDPLAEPIPDGPSCQRMAGLARRLGCHIAFGLPEKEEILYYDLPRASRQPRER